jgi:hypothetical protein
MRGAARSMLRFESEREREFFRDVLRFREEKKNRFQAAPFFSLFFSLSRPSLTFFFSLILLLLLFLLIRRRSGERR